MKNDQIEDLVKKVQAFPDVGARQTALDLVQAILELHGDALERIMEVIAAGEGGPAIIDAVAVDPRTSSILLLHDLHPLDLESRVARALADPAFGSRGASVELVAIQDGVIRVAVNGGPGLKAAVEKALWEAAPEATAVLLDGPPEQVSTNFVPLEALLAG